MMNTKNLYIFLIGLLACCQSLLAQNESGDMIRGKVTSDLGEELISAAVLEIDATGRVVGNTLTDINGDFALKIKNTRNKLRCVYLGFVPKETPIGTKKDFVITMKEDNALAEVVITGKKTVSSGGMDIPFNEVPFAMQRISASAFEGISVSSIDDALQGHIAGLDIIGSGNVGTGTQMRIRGISSLNSNSSPLIVINGIPRSDISTENFDFSAATEQQFSDLLMLNPEDIEDIAVLKDAGATAIWGSRGASGVLLITTKKGVRGSTRVTYTYKYSGSQQPPGIKMLNGNDYTMLMKQAYFNPSQNNTSSGIPEFNYDPTFSEYRHYNNNTDWRKEVIQYGLTHDHYIQISGGGERARFRITGGYMGKDGSIIGQKWDRLTSRMDLDYQVSSRILFTSQFAFTYSDTDHNWEDGRGDHEYINGKSLLYLAYKKMPNMSVYSKDANGRDTGEYYNMLQSSGLATGEREQGFLRNPVALGRLATNNEKAYNIEPTLRLQYDLLDPSEQTLRYETYVSFDMRNNKKHKLLPKEVSSRTWDNEDINRVDDEDTESFGIKSENKLLWRPNTGKNHSIQMYSSLYTESGNNNSESMLAYGYPSREIADPSAPAYLKTIKSSLGQWRQLAVNAQIHYAYMGKYVIDATYRREGSTKFGKDNKYGNFPGVSMRWNISSEPFMAPASKWLTMFSLRPSWGITGTTPGYEYMHFSKYSPWDSYNGTTTIRPENIRLSNLKWEKMNMYNLGTDVELWSGKYTMDANVYYARISDLLFENPPIPTSSGFDKLTYRNVGEITNVGWEVNVHGNSIIRAGDFSISGYFNLANSVNSLLSLNEDILNAKNKDLAYDKRNAPYLERLQIGHAYGSIYGFRYKGVYQYSIDNPDLEASAYTAGSAPMVRNAAGEIIFDSKGKPLPMYYNYGPNGINYQFQGGDAIYEDINHDGSIDELDIVYLGNSNPKLSGGFGLTFKWKSLSCNTYFTFRYGNKIVNTTRREAENMLTDNNQSIATNYRWRQEGDLTQMPRALHDYGYNSLPSDRYVEDGSFIRFKHLTLNYAVPSEWLRKYYLKQMNLYMTFTNLLCFTKYLGVDPEINYDGQGLSNDKSITPRSRDFTLGITLGF